MKKETVTVKLTHKGWLGFAPVYIAATFTDCPFLHPRIPFTGWFITLNAAMFNLIASVHGAGSGFPIRITGRLDTPRTVVV